VDFLNQEIAQKTSYAADIVFSTSTNGFVYCRVTTPAGLRSFAISFTPNLCKLLGFDAQTVISGGDPQKKGSRLPDPYADFKLIEVKSSNADAFSTAQMPPESNYHPETTVALLQICGNNPMDDIVSTPFSNSRPVSLYSVSIPMESVVFYPLSAQALYTVKFKLLSQSGQVLKVDSSLPVVLHVILRKGDHTFV
jgi:hypothetical protein